MYRSAPLHLNARSRLPPIAAKMCALPHLIKLVFQATSGSDEKWTVSLYNYMVPFTASVLFCFFLLDAPAASLVANIDRISSFSLYWAVMQAR